MDTNKLEVFIELAKASSYSKAARELGYTHAGIAYMIKSMEEEFGIELVKKKGNGISLTKEAAELLPYMRNVIESMNELSQAAAEKRPKSMAVLNIGAIDSAAAKWVPIAVSKFKEKYPHINTNILTGDPFEMNDWLQSKEIDLAITDGTWADKTFDWILLVKDAYYGLFPRNYMHDGPVPMSNFEGQSLYIPSKPDNRSILNLLEQNNISYNELEGLNSLSAISTSIAAGHGVSIASGLMIDIHHIRNAMPDYQPKILPIAPTAQRDIGISLRKDLHKKDFTREFISCMKTVIKKYPVNTEV